MSKTKPHKANWTFFHIFYFTLNFLTLRESCGNLPTTHSFHPKWRLFGRNVTQLADTQKTYNLRGESSFINKERLLRESRWIKYTWRNSLCSSNKKMNQLLGHAPLFLRMKHWIVTEAFALLRQPQIWIYFLWKGEAVCQWRALITEARQEKTCSKVSGFISGWKIFNAQRRNWALNTFSETTSLNKLHQFVRISFFLFLIILLYKPLRFITGHVIIMVFPVCEALYFVFVLSVLLKINHF